MKALCKLGFWMTILMIALLSCQKNDDSDSNNPDNPAVVMQDVALSGTVRNTNGNPLSGVRVTTGSLNATTGSDGTFTFNKAGTVNDRVILKYEKSGYFTLTRSCDKDSDLYVEAMLYPQGNSDISLQTTFDASAAKTLQVSGMKIDFPASSILSADGKAYSGNVHADLLYLAPDNANLTGMMPGGDWTCRLSNNNVEALQSYGITDVTLTDGSGNLLKIKEDAGVKISFPVLSAMRTGAPASLSLWSFDQTKGVWVEDGTLTLQNNAYEGTVKHFSPEAAGKSNKKMTLKVRVLACDQPKAGVKVSIRDDWDYEDYAGFTNSDGYCSVSSSLWWGDAYDTKVFATYHGETKSMDVLASDFGLQIVLFNFDDACGAVGQLVVDGKTFPLVESESLMIIGGGIVGSLEFGNNNPYISFVLSMNIPASNNDLPNGTFSCPNGGILGGVCSGYADQTIGGLTDQENAQMIVSKSDNMYNITITGYMRSAPFIGDLYISEFQLTYNGAIEVGRY